MKMMNAELILSDLYKDEFGSAPAVVSPLMASGSDRRYFRLSGVGGTVIGAYNADKRENEAFVSFTSTFLKSGLPVPEILGYDALNDVYLLRDLGDDTLFQLITIKRAAQSDKPVTESPLGCGRISFSEDILEIYRKVLAWLPVFQIDAGVTIDYNACYPRKAFDRQSMMWDLNYFKYYFLKLAGIPYDEQALEDDFSSLCDLLLKADRDYFLYRDFQSRNIMVVGGEPWFIDYQGGRKGALQYDLASLLYDAKADLPEEVRAELLGVYLKELGQYITVDRDKFIREYYGYVLIRILQALGAYGFRGYYEKKSHFLQSIPYALENLRFLRKEGLLAFGLDTLMAIIDRITGAPKLFNQIHEINSFISLNNNDISNSIKKKLNIIVSSFSFKSAIPDDPSGNGGGFVFDCRALPNPGRLEEYRQLTGKDNQVSAYLESMQEVKLFLEHIYVLIDQSVMNYKERGFTHLMVSFGCTGGQHRSVYCAEMLARHLQQQEGVIVEVRHHEQELRK